MIVRTAGKQDIDAMAALDRRCFSVPWSRESFRREIEENPAAVYLVAESTETRSLLGYAGLWMVAGEGHITNVAVAPEARRRKIGKTLLEELMEHCRRTAGAALFILEVRRGNGPAIALYRRLGFREAGVRKNYYEDNGEDALILTVTEEI